MDEIMSKLQYLSFEINDECPLEKEHPQCPRNIKDRYAKSSSSEPITVNDIVGFYHHCVEYHGFCGIVNFSYYNEPMATKERMIEIMKALPEAKFSLMTNGMFLDETPECGWIISHCKDVVVTVYEQTNVGIVDLLCIRYEQMRKWAGGLDDRINENIIPVYRSDITHCGRPNFDLTIDYYGNGHICCGDWRGEINIGNIKTDCYEKFLSKWNIIRNELSKPINEINYKDLPRVCKLCFARTPHVSGVG